MKRKSKAFAFLIVKVTILVSLSTTSLAHSRTNDAILINTTSTYKKVEYSSTKARNTTASSTAAKAIETTEFSGTNMETMDQLLASFMPTKNFFYFGSPDSITNISIWNPSDGFEATISDFPNASLTIDHGDNEIVITGAYYKYVRVNYRHMYALGNWTVPFAKFLYDLRKAYFSEGYSTGFIELSMKSDEKYVSLRDKFIEIQHITYNFTSDKLRTSPEGLEATAANNYTVWNDAGQIKLVEAKRKAIFKHKETKFIVDECAYSSKTQSQPFFNICENSAEIRTSVARLAFRKSAANKTKFTIPWTRTESLLFETKRVAEAILLYRRPSTNDSYLTLNDATFAEVFEFCPDAKRIWLQNGNGNFEYNDETGDAITWDPRNHTSVIHRGARALRTDAIIFSKSAANTTISTLNAVITICSKTNL